MTNDTEIKISKSVIKAIDDFVKHEGYVSHKIMALAPGSNKGN